ncbi:type II toxin-antitoxin system ParD family antitoxin [Maridesulfovibrio sp.]|uniref:type II toxin-antitoxin system ParD family antitoxin n=1 Tax=Maridesulfovibrio sp. TaxID=2795000 RepID=UPI002AA92A9D|nr:type II toxin-antitoxin system ParD family antitoxin [Maridesulfovibrio sp.]
MHISLTPELEAQVKSKVQSGHYNNASEVIREALRFMITNEDLVNMMKIEAMQKKLAVGEEQAKSGNFTDSTIPDIIKEAKLESDA